MNFIKLSLNEISSRIEPICRDQDAVLSVYVFGSSTDIENKKPKDIDIAVLLDKDYMTSFSVPSFMSALESSLGCPVDVVVLNRAGEVLKREVRRTGKLIFDRSPRIRKRFEIQSRKSYEDFLFLHKRYVNKVLYGGKNG